MKNPKECFCLKQNQTFFVLNELTMAEGKDGSEPLTFHHETFSRFKFVIINQDKQPTTANIPVAEFPGIFEEIKAKNLLRKVNGPENKMNGMLNSIGKMTQKLVKKFAGQENQVSAVKVNTNSPAFTLAISAGQLKGKTPVAALMENAEANKQLLINQIAWLESNLNRYPKNREQIQAVKEALDLYEKGLLTKSAVSATSQATKNTDSNVVYHTGFRPLIRRKNRNGKCFVYEIKILWHENLPKPVEIEIRNYFAPVVQDEKGLLNVKAKEREDEIKNSFSMTMEEWFWMEHMIEAQIRTFENISAPNAYRQATDAEKANRNAALGYNTRH